MAGGFQARIHHYGNTAFHKTYLAPMGDQTNTTGNNIFAGTVLTSWGSTAAITQIDVIAPGGSRFESGTIFSLYGLK